ncbi:DNA adenine methylase [Roseimaritima sediminicola]|uniref:DNA adenine methylase n=1 Tax=Roseimaritima sediminicola TaxID=2662066 RepID=UPI001F33A9AF|nr:DNA adenine methylase [Roseimaritima sediminicola]
MTQSPLFEDAQMAAKPNAAIDNKQTKGKPKPKPLTQPLKWHGGKHYLAKRIIDLMPEHLHYVEPFFGGGSVLLNKDPHGVSEVINDVHRELTNFWRTLQDEERFARFMRVVEAVPFSEVEWKESFEPTDDPIEQAVRFFIRCRQSRAGKLNAFATLSRNRTRRQMNEQASSWMNAVNGLPEIARRMRRVVVLCQDAVKVVKRQDGDNTLFYLDPPYVHESRVTTADYDFEMTTEQHERLLDAICQCKGKVLLSGYPNELYDQRLKDWNVVDIQIDNKASSKKNKPKMTERLWMNY